MSFPPFTCDRIAFGNVSYCSTGKMSMPDGSFHVRGMEFRIPRFKSVPSVSCQIIGEKDACPLVVYALKINDNVAGMTQIAIEAQTLDGKPASGVHHCNILVIGSPLTNAK
jgi:hypothetical protein